MERFAVLMQGRKDLSIPELPMSKMKFWQKVEMQGKLIRKKKLILNLKWECLILLLQVVFRAKAFANSAFQKV